jgi:hypothetical protein
MFYPATANNIITHKKQFVVTHTIRQTQIPAKLDSSVTNTTAAKMPYQQKIASPYIVI